MDTDTNTFTNELKKIRELGINNKIQESSIDNKMKNKQEKRLERHINFCTEHIKNFCRKFAYKNKNTLFFCSMSDNFQMELNGNEQYEQMISDRKAYVDLCDDVIREMISKKLGIPICKIKVDNQSDRFKISW